VLGFKIKQVGNIMTFQEESPDSTTKNSDMELFKMVMKNLDCSIPRGHGALMEGGEFPPERPVVLGNPYTVEGFFHRRRF
jgi:hypothetical protein